MRTELAPALLLVAAMTVAGCSSDSDAAKDTTKTPTTKASANAAAGQNSECDGSIESPSTDFMVDACGRVVILRGANVESSAKGGKQSDVHLPKSDREFQEQIKGNWGWNSVRFLVFWGAIEPEKGKYDEKYLDQVEEWVNWYSERNIHVVLDIHQDLYGWKVDGDGAPDWAVDTQGLELQDMEDDGPWWLRGADPAVQAAYQSFWNPKDGDTELQDHYMGALTHLAKRFADHPAVIGYDVMNEPSFANGDLAATLALQPQAEAGKFKNENLTNFMNKGIEAVRAASPDQYVFIEPTSLLNFFPYPTDLIADQIKDPRKGDPRVVYAGHLYEPAVHEGSGYSTDSTYVDEWFKLRTAEAKQMKSSLWFGEWGGDGSQDRMADYIEDVTGHADDAMAGWSIWSWDPGSWSPVDGDGKISKNGTALLRVQPQAIAGTPTSFGWTSKTKVFKMAWDERDEVKANTEIAVPSLLFADGFQVVLDGKNVDEPAWDKATSTLTVSPDRAVAKHQICIAPKASKACN